MRVCWMFDENMQSTPGMMMSAAVMCGKMNWSKAGFTKRKYCCCTDAIDRPRCFTSRRMRRARRTSLSVSTKTFRSNSCTRTRDQPHFEQSICMKTQFPVREWAKLHVNHLEASLCRQVPMTKFPRDENTRRQKPQNKITMNDIRICGGYTDRWIYRHYNPAIQNISTNQMLS